MWVDEEPDTMGFIEVGRRYDIDIHQFRSWDKAREVLERRYDRYAAVVLDGAGVVNAGEAADADFLYQAVRELEAISAQHEDMMPWYVLSRGTAEDFERTLQRVAKGKRSEMETEWGRLYFRKGSDLESLLVTIKHAAAGRSDNKVRMLYRDVFKVIDSYFTPDTRQTMLDILGALHFPEQNRQFDPVLYYTQLRRILEHLFRAANRIGLLPDEVLGEDDKVNLSNSSLYLSGREVYTGKRTFRVARNADVVFPPVIAQLVKSILVVANKNSHTVELDPQGRTRMQDYYATMQSNNLLFGYALHLCDVIVWFGRYADRYLARNAKRSGSSSASLASSC